MGQANVRRWIDDILPLLTDGDDPLGVDTFATHHVPLDEAPARLRDLPEEAGRRHQGRAQPLTASMSSGANTCSCVRHDTQTRTRVWGGGRLGKLRGRKRTSISPRFSPFPLTRLRRPFPVVASGGSFGPPAILWSHHMSTTSSRARRARRTVARATHESPPAVSTGNQGVVQDHRVLRLRGRRGRRPDRRGRRR